MNLKKNWKVFTSKSVGTGSSSYEKKNLPGCGLRKVEKHRSKLYSFLLPDLRLPPSVKAELKGRLYPI